MYQLSNLLAEVAVVPAGHHPVGLDPLPGLDDLAGAAVDRDVGEPRLAGPGLVLDAPVAAARVEDDVARRQVRMPAALVAHLRGAIGDPDRALR